MVAQHIGHEPVASSGVPLPYPIDARHYIKYDATP
jgi:hypothetical protein